MSTEEGKVELEAHRFAIPTKGLIQTETIEEQTLNPGVLGWGLGAHGSAEAFQGMLKNLLGVGG